MASSVCKHEKKRLEIIQSLQYLDQDKIGLQFEIRDIKNSLDDIKEKYVEMGDLNYFIKLIVKEWEEELKEEVSYLEDMMDGLKAKDLEYVEMYENIKKEVVEDKCTCIKNFNSL